MLTPASELTQNLHVEPKFPEVRSLRVRKKSTNFDYEGKEQPILDPIILHAGGLTARPRLCYLQVNLARISLSSYRNN